MEAARTAPHHQIAQFLPLVGDNEAAAEKHRRFFDFRQGRDLKNQRHGTTSVRPHMGRYVGSLLRRPGECPSAPPLTDLAKLRPDTVAIRWDKRCMFLRFCAECRGKTSRSCLIGGPSDEFLSCSFGRDSCGHCFIDCRSASVAKCGDLFVIFCSSRVVFHGHSCRLAQRRHQNFLH